MASWGSWVIICWSSAFLIFYFFNIVWRVRGWVKHHQLQVEYNWNERGAFPACLVAVSWWCPHVQCFMVMSAGHVCSSWRIAVMVLLWVCYLPFHLSFFSPDHLGPIPKHWAIKCNFSGLCADGKMVWELRLTPVRLFFFVLLQFYSGCMWEPDGIYAPTNWTSIPKHFKLVKVSIFG